MLEAVKPKVKIELERLVSEGIIRHIECQTDWINSIVTATKADGSIRLCLDPRDLNKYIRRLYYYSPIVDDILSDLQGSKFLSTLDDRSGYRNIPLCEKSQLLSTFNIPGFGRFCFCRLPFGLVSRHDLIRRVMYEILSSILNATPVADDIKIHGRTERDHDLTLLNLLDKCRSSGLHINLENQETICEILREYAYNRWFTAR